MRKILCLVFLSVCFIQSFSQNLNNEWIDYNKSYYKFKVGGFGTDVVNGNAILKNGIVRIPYSTIASAGLGGTSSAHFQLWRDGEEVPVYISKVSGTLGAADYIEFWGAINNGKPDTKLYRDPSLQLSDYWSLQTDTAAYFLTANAAGINKRFEAQTFDLTNNTSTPVPYFMHTVGRYFKTELLGGFSAVAGQSIYSSSYDMGEGYTSRAIRPNSCGTQPQLPQNFFNLYPYTGTVDVPAPDMIMRLNSVGNAPNSRTVKVLLNNDSITRYQMDYFTDARVEEYIPVSKISGGTANFIAINQSTASCDQFRISMIELNYPRKFNFDNASNFSFNVNAASEVQYIEIKNFNYGGVTPVIYDLTHQARYIGDISTSGTVKLLLPASSTPFQLVITSQAGTNYKTINSLQTRNFTNYALQANQGDYLMISNPLLYGSGSSNYVQQYSDYRSSATGGSYNSKIIDINELVDQFAWGIKKHPFSVKNFLAYARKNFAVAPKFVFLLGKGLTYNAYRTNEPNALADQLNLVPTWGSPASDNVLSSKDFTALPEIPIGRLSVVTPEEVGTYLAKVKQYDSAQQSTDHSIEGRNWMKNVLQIAGANDLGLGNQLDGYLDIYKNIIKDTAFGANVTNFSKNANPAGYTDAILSFKKIYEQGSALITYFGHSSSTSLDFNLDKPENYNNEKKYPLFIANGCNAGNNFDFETNRFNIASTISERFIVASKRGAIGYLATTSFGVVNYLNMYTNQFYKAFAKTKYNQPIGVAIKEGIRATLQSTGSPDFFSRVHAEQYSLNGDPAVKMNASAIPDYAVGEPEIEVTPSFISVADSSFSVKVKVYNLGRSTKDSVGFRLKRITPAGETSTIISKRLAPLSLNDSVTTTVLVKGITNKGTNTLVAIIDEANELTEITKTNNTASKEIVISEDEIRPVFPYNNAIVNSPGFQFQGSTVNPLRQAINYIMEIDTTEHFNSPLKKSVTVNNATGGVITFNPSMTLVNNTVYYWRVSPVIAVMPWRIASFRYEEGSATGFEQSHYYQHAAANLKDVVIDSTDRKFKFANRTNNLFIVNSIYPTSGTEDSHFSVSVNGNQVIASACDGPVLQFNVINPITFEPWKNVTTAGVGLYGSGPSDCALTRQYNFEYRTTDPTSRGKAMQLMDLIPKGYYVVVRTVSSPDNNINSYVGAWKADTAVYGKGNSIYHRLKGAGFATVDSFTKARTFSFVYKKEDTTFAPRSAMSDGVNDRINLDVNCFSPDTSGQITSVNYGPAKAWKKVKWAGSNIETGNDADSLKVIGINKNGEDTLLYTLTENQQDFDISSINASHYRYLKLSLETKDNLTATPYQLNYYRVEYEAAPEGGLAPNLYLDFPDTLRYTAGRGAGTNDYMVQVGFKNASVVAFDSLALRVILYDSANNSFKFNQEKTRPLAAGDTLHVQAVINSTGLSGYYNVYLEVNPDKAQPEQYSFNNFMYKRVYIQGAQTLPVNLLAFTAVLQQSNVLTNWSVANEKNIKDYQVEHSPGGDHYNTIATLSAKTTGVTNEYQFLHLNVPDGKNYYRLKITDADGMRKYSPTRLISIDRKTVVTIFPNPVKSLLNIKIKTLDGKASTVRLLNSFGQQLKQLKVSGSTQIDMSGYAAGLYLLQVNDGVENITYKIQKR
ncbi:MAG: C25 family cysteine peptidase [Chitinophagaceae bacterium]|nr:C25 family cysteine peptidase [Chitinophagaceae bacterium]